MLILTEKPSVAAAFAGALGCPKKDGYYENNDYCIVNAVGHLLQQYEPEDYDPKYKKWQIEDLPILPEKVKYKVIDKTKSQLAVIKKCFDAHRIETRRLCLLPTRNGKEKLSGRKYCCMPDSPGTRTRNAFGCRKR